MIWAAINGKSQAIQTLFDNGADIHARDKNCCTALMIAANFQPKEIVEILLKNGTDSNHKDTDGFRAIDYIYKSPHKGVVKLLRQYGTK